MNENITITLPAERVRAFLRDALGTAGIDLSFLAKQEATAPRIGSALILHPAAIGDAYEGGIYAGLTIGPDGQPARLILLPGEAESINWKDAGEWAKKQGGELPSRFDALLLFKNLKPQFKQEAYWTAEQHADAPDCAWGQYFDWGIQHYWRKVNKIRARAVRRSPI